VLNITGRLLDLELKCLIDLLEFTLVSLVHHTHLLPKRGSILEVIFPGASVQSINLFVHASFLFKI
jgi:hypothetical protein